MALRSDIGYEGGSQGIEPDPNQPTPTTGGPDTPSAPITAPAPQPQAQPRHIIQTQESTWATPQPPVPHYEWTPPTSVYEPEHPSYNAQMYMDRTRTLLHNTIEHTGTMPNPDVLHDFVRSGLSIDAIRAVWQQMMERQPVPTAAEARTKTARDLSVVQHIPWQLQQEIGDKPVIDASASAHAGLKYDRERDAFINNTSNPAPKHIDVQQLVAAALHGRSDTDLGKMLAGLRAVRPDLVARAMPLVDHADIYGRYNWAGAIAQVAAADPEMAGLVAQQLKISLPGQYGGPQEAKWAAAVQHFDETARTRDEQWNAIMASPDKFVAYPLVVQRLNEAAASNTSPRDQVFDSIMRMNGVKYVSASNSNRGGPSQPGHWNVDAKTLQQYNEQADWLSQQLSSEGKNYIEVDGQKITLFRSGAEAGKLDYNDWANENPGASLALGILNPVNYLGPGSVIKTGYKFGRLPIEMAKMSALIRDARLARIERDTKTAAELRTAAKAPAAERDEIQATLNRWPYNKRLENQYKPDPNLAKETQFTPGKEPVQEGHTRLWRGSGPARAKMAEFEDSGRYFTPLEKYADIYNPGQLGKGLYGHVNYVDVPTADLKNYLKGTFDQPVGYDPFSEGSADSLKHLNIEYVLPDEVIQKMGVRGEETQGMRTHPNAPGEPIEGTAQNLGIKANPVNKPPTKAQNMATLRGLQSQFKANNQALQDALRFQEAHATEEANITKSLAAAQTHLNSLVNSGHPLPDQEAVIFDAQQKLNGIQIRLADHRQLAPPDPKQVQALKDKQNELWDQLNDHVTSASLPVHPDSRAAQKEIDDINIQTTRLRAMRNLKGQDAEAIDGQMADLIQRKRDAQAKYLDSTSPFNHLRSTVKLLQKQWVDAANRTTALEHQAQQHEELLARILASDGQSRLSRLFNSSLHSWHELEYAENNPDSIISNGLRLMNTGKILRQDVEKEIVKGMGKYRGQLQFFIEHPDQVPEDAQRMVTDIRAFFADAASELTNREIIEDIEKEYFPHWTHGQQSLFRAAVGFRGELPTTGGFAKDRLVQEAESAIPDEQAVGEYLQAVTRVIAARHMRAAISDGHFASGREMFISGTRVPRSGSLPLALTKGKAYVYRDTFQGWVDKDISDLLDKVNAPIGRFKGGRVIGTFDSKAEAQAAAKDLEAKTSIKEVAVSGGSNGNKTTFTLMAHDQGQDFFDRWAEFNNGYKKWAMRIPLVHMWNQLSAGMGAGLTNIPIGAIVSRHPEALALASREMFLQPSKMIADAVEKIIAENPEQQELAEALDFARKKENRVFATADHFLWDSVVRNQQIGVWYTLRSKLIRQGYDPKDAGIAAGTLAQQIVGISNPKLLTKVEKFLRDYGLFAYSWNKKHVTIPAQAIPHFGRKAALKFNPELTEQQAKLVEGLSQKYIMRYALMAPLSLAMAQFAMNGTPFWENEDGHQLDLEWTRIHDLTSEPDGQRHYITWPLMNFARFYTSKAQMFADDGPIGGFGTNLANITMPIPAFAIAELMNWQNLSPQEFAGQAVQQIDPWNRNLLGPVTRAIERVERGQGQWSDIPLSFMGLTGIKTYSGKHQPYVVTPSEDRHRRAVDLELALNMHINPLEASASDRGTADAHLASDSLFDASSEFLHIAGGGSVGQGSAENRLQMDLDHRIEAAVLDAGIGQAEIDSAKRNNKPLFSLLTNSEVQKLLNDHPDIQYALNAHSNAKEENDRKLKDARASFFNGLDKVKAIAHEKQQQLDDALNLYYRTGGKQGMAPDKWRAAHKENRAAEYNKTVGLRSGVSQEVWDVINKPLSQDDPLYESKIAYDAYHAVSLDDDKYQNNNINDPQSYLGVNIKAWQDDRNVVLARYSPEIQEYIHNKDNQNRTQTELQYEDAASKYGKFLDQHTFDQKQENIAMSLTSTERRIYMELHPAIKKYMALKDNWWRAHPDVASFYKPMDEFQWNSWKPDVQAVKLADWTIENRIGHPEYLTDWQKEVVLNPKAQQKAIAGWTQAEVKLYYAYLQQDEIDYKNRYKHKPSKTATAKHFGNQSYASQPNIFANQAAPAGGSQTQSIF